MNRDNIIKKIKRVVIKIGSKALSDEGKISYARIKYLASDVERLRSSGIESLIGSIGSVYSRRK